MEIEIIVKPGKVAKILLSIITVLLAGQFLFLFTRFIYGYSYYHLFQIFNFDEEGNLPTFYSTFALILAAVLLFVIGTIKSYLKEKGKGYWIFLGILFLLMAYDEAAQFHEMFNEYFWESPNLPTWLGFGWVIPFSALTLIIGAFFIRFLISLPKSISRLFILAGIIFIAGAIGMELPGAYLWFNTGGFNSLWYNLAATIEELLEMLGIVIFIYAILKYLKMQYGSKLKINFSQS
jgi:hypothetical protein